MFFLPLRSLTGRYDGWQMALPHPPFLIYILACRKHARSSGAPLQAFAFVVAVGLHSVVDSDGARHRRVPTRPTYPCREEARSRPKGSCHCILRSGSRRGLPGVDPRRRPHDSGRGGRAAESHPYRQPLPSRFRQGGSSGAEYSCPLHGMLHSACGEAPAAL